MPKKLTQEEVIERAKILHGDKYDYSKVEYKNANTKVCIICKTCGKEFWQIPSGHLRGKGCPYCSGNVRLTTDTFIKRAKEVHGDRYDYSLVEYVNSATKVKIICPEHGVFEQSPNLHLQGRKCPYCNGKKRLDLMEFINKANIVHGDFYDYSKVIYVNNRTKVEIICPIHGSFLTTPHAHLAGSGCPICGKLKCAKSRTKDLSCFVSEANEVHGNKYDYSKVEYINSSTKIEIICLKHGPFWQTPNNHLHGYGCPKCGMEVQSQKRTKSFSFFLNKAKSVHGDKYDYSKVNYVNTSTVIEIICRKHGSFWQTPNSHLKGCGCPYCKTSKGEDLIDAYLGKHNLSYKRQFNIKLDAALFSRNNLRVDFFLTDVNAIIEFNGIQHYERNPYFHKDDNDFLLQIDRDNRLKEYCKKNKIKLIVIKYDEIDKIECILDKKLNIKKRNNETT